MKELYDFFRTIFVGFGIVCFVLPVLLLVIGMYKPYRMLAKRAGRYDDVKKVEDAVSDMLMETFRTWLKVD